MDTNRFNAEHEAKSRAVCERIEREDAECRGKLADLVDAQLKGELGRAKAESDGWRKIAERRLKHTDECEAALAKRNERISKLEKQVGYLRAELANAEVLSERERKILDMWPRFEDGKRVWFGDEMEDHHGGATVVGAIEFSRGKVCVKDAEDDDWDTSIHAIHPLKRPAPKVLDADGVEIKFGDAVYGIGRNQHLYEIIDPHHIDPEVGEAFSVRCYDRDESEECHCRPELLTHTLPDSWERLEKDALKGVCEYAEEDRKPGTIDAHTCCGCRFDEDGDGPTCEKQMALDIIRRAKALAGVEVDE